MEIFSINFPINFFEEGRWLLAVNSFEATNSVFNIKNGENRFLVTTPKQWIPEGGDEPINKLNDILELRSQNDFGLHGKKVERRGTRKEIEN